MISEATIDEIRTRVSLVDLVSENVVLKQQGGGGLVGLCPFHNEKTPSFHVRPQENRYHCFGCGASGDVITYAMESQGLSFVEAVELLAARGNIVIEHTGSQKKSAPGQDRQQLWRVNALAQKFFRQQLSSNTVIQKYLEERRIHSEAIMEFQVGAAPPGWDGLVNFLRKHKVPEPLMLSAGLVRRSSRGELYDTFRARLVFPVFINARQIAGFGGRIIPGLVDEQQLCEAPKYLNSHETPIYQKRTILFGLPQAIPAIKAEKRAYLVEGYLDVISLWQVDVRNVVATCGTSVTAEHARRLANITADVTVLFDGDDAGRKAAARSFVAFRDAAIDAGAIFLPAGEDPDTIALKAGAQTRKQLEKFDRAPLFDCFVNASSERIGAATPENLGPAAKGKLALELVGAIEQINNVVAREEYLKRTAFLLMTEVADLHKLAKPNIRSDVPELELTKTNETEQRAIVNVRDLPRIDQTALRCVMALREEAASAILRDSNLCEVLSGPTLIMIEELQEAFSVDDSRRAVQQLLNRNGKEWVAYWRETHLMREDPAVDFKRMTQECFQAAHRIKLEQLLQRTQQQLRRAVDEEERNELARLSITLNQQLKSSQPPN